MKTEECAAKAQIDSIIRKLDPDKLQACTTATGLADARKLADAVIDGMWFFLGVQVDPIGLRPQRVRLLEVKEGDRLIHAVIVEEGQRLLASSSQGRAKILDRLDRMQIEVDWTEEAGDIR